MDVGAEVGTGERLDGAGQIGEGDPPIHHQTFDLMEDGEVAGVRSIAAVAAARHDRVDRQRAFQDGLLHQVDLHRRGVGAQQRRLGLAEVEVEGVPHAPGRVGRGDVEGTEVEPVRLDLGPLGHVEPHADEHIFECVSGLGHQVEVAALVGASNRAGHVLGQVEPGGGHLGRQLGEADLGALGLEQRLDRGAGLVELAAHLLLGLGIHRSQRPGRLGQGGLLTAHGGSHVADGLGGVGRLDGSTGVSHQASDIGHRRHSGTPPWSGPVDASFMGDIVERAEAVPGVAASCPPACPPARPPVRR